MILSDRDILKFIESGDIEITPFDRDCLGTNSYDVHLAPTLLVYEVAFPAYDVTQRTAHTLIGKTLEEPYLDCKIEPKTLELTIPEQGFILYPGTLYLAATVEHTSTYKHIPFLEGKSSLGRLGLSIHVTAGKGEVGFVGFWTAEMTVIHPLRVYAGMPVGQLFYHEVSSLPLVDYRDKSTQKYSHSNSPKPIASKMYKNFPDGVPLPKDPNRQDR